MTKPLVLAVSAVWVFATGCGGTLQQFAGTWVYSDGTVNVANCGDFSGQQPLTNQTTEEIQVVDGQLEKTDSNGCTTRFNVDGRVATLDPAYSSCSVTLPAPGTLQANSYTMTLSEDGSSIATSFDADFIASGQTGACDITGVGTLVKR